MRNKKGITLVSLVVTIIVLIILAGVSINLTLGENGIITIAKKARENMELAKEDEERQLNELYAQIVTEGGSSGSASDDAIIRLVEFKRQIASALTDMGIATEETADATTMSSNIRNLSGASSADKVSYDNTNSGLTATNVQGAVDELNSSLSSVGTIRITCGRSYSFTGGETSPITTTNAQVPDGYIPISIVGVNTGNIANSVSDYGLVLKEDGNVSSRMFNAYNTNASNGTVTFTVLCIKLPN